MQLRPFKANGCSYTLSMHLYSFLPKYITINYCFVSLNFQDYALPFMLLHLSNNNATLHF